MPSMLVTALEPLAEKVPFARQIAEKYRRAAMALEAIGSKRLTADEIATVSRWVREVAGLVRHSVETLPATLTVAVEFKKRRHRATDHG